jgi:hypothetical protein
MYDKQKHNNLLCEKEAPMIEYLGFIYGVTKDIKDYLKGDEESKVVDREWLEKSGFGKEMENRGYKLYWSRPEKIESRKLDGYEIIVEVDKIKRVRKRIVWNSGNDSLVLLGKKENT